MRSPARWDSEPYRPRRSGSQAKLPCALAVHQREGITVAEAREIVHLYDKK